VSLHLSAFDNSTPVSRMRDRLAVRRAVEKIHEAHELLVLAEIDARKADEPAIARAINTAIVATAEAGTFAGVRSGELT
jgi:hypothetical protein